MIDLQVNGLSIRDQDINCSFWDLPSHVEIQKLCDFFYREGVHGFLATLITDDPSKIQEGLENIAAFQRIAKANSSQLIGVHIEGGYISRLGTHSRSYATSLDPSCVEKWARRFPDLIKLWTICPLVDADSKHVEMQKKYNIRTSYGHSNANYYEAMKAFNVNEVFLVTHWGNGMNIFDSSLNFNRDEPSTRDLELLDGDAFLDSAALGKAAYDHKQVMMMAICGSDRNQDKHISPKLINKLSKTNRLILVSDCVARAAGYQSENTNTSKSYQLIGGQTSLARHCLNAASEAGLSENEISQACELRPRSLVFSY